MGNTKLDFDQVYADFHPRMRRYLARMVGEYEAEDLTHEVFVKVYQALPVFRGESELSTWIYRIATNTAFDRLRSLSYHGAAQSRSTDDPAEGYDPQIEDGNTWTGEKAPMLEQQVYRKEMNDCILDYVNRLPEAYRTVILLSEFEGLRNKVISEVLGVTLDTVKIRLHRARKKLKEQISINCGTEWIEGNEFVPELTKSGLEFLKDQEDNPADESSPCDP